MTTAFSGAHPFRPQCLTDLLDADYLEDEYETTPTEHLARLVTAIDAGRCPRCGRTLAANQMPAGSRVTRCRCVPVCGPCGEHEVPHLIDPNDWPAVDPSEVDDDRAELIASADAGIISGATLVTEDGASELRSRPHPGGWSEFGYDESADQQERES